MKRSIFISSNTQRDALADEIRNMEIGEYGLHLTINTQKRTLKQNAALWKYMELLANDLNEGGLDMRHVIKQDVEIPWNKDTVKQYLWGPIQKVVMGELSTTKLDRCQVSEVYAVLARHMAEKFSISTPFPSNEAPMI